jgi:acetylcholinesterase
MQSNPIRSPEPDPVHNLIKSFLDTPHVPQSEDCLYLNVYAPSAPSGPTGRAVMFWLYGGGLQFGTSMQFLYDGSTFAAYQDVIMVTTNYRTNGKTIPLWLSMSCRRALV